ncbi:glycosyltransferase family A protein [Helicobacter sp.]|uniref:glycosyltransferase family A protein n=1 Tax=Helicobacter sp. TaxID=218 RepID=UPI0025B895A9|nr:glycosyltransferase family A protein [Helicobacter sp.]
MEQTRAIAEKEIMFYIIIPIYNVEQYLKKCLDSLLNQSYSKWVAVLINDGSTDSSGTIAQEYTSKDTRFILLNQTNQGLSTARNAGLEMVKNLLASTTPPPIAIFTLYSLCGF